MADLRERDVGADALLLDGDDVLDGAVFGVAGHLARAQLPAEPRPPEQVERRLVVLHLGRRHQRGQDDPRLAAVDDVVVVVAEVRAAVARRQRRGVGVGGAGPEVGRAPVGAARRVAVGAAGLPDPVVAGGGALGQGGARLVRQRDRQRRRRVAPASRSGSPPSAGHRRHPSPSAAKSRGEVGLDGEARLERVERGVGRDLGRVDVELLAPDQPRRDALLDDRLEEAAEDVQPVALADAGQAGVVGQRLGQVVARGTSAG